MVGSNVYAVRVTCSTMHTIESDKCAWRATPNPKSITMPSPLWLRHNVSIMFLHCLIANSMFIGAQTPAHSPFSPALASSFGIQSFFPHSPFAPQFHCCRSHLHSVHSARTHTHGRYCTQRRRLCFTFVHGAHTLYRLPHSLPHCRTQRR